jgi:hypothetical protein
VVEYLPSKNKGLHSTPINAKRKKGSKENKGEHCTLYSTRKSKEMQIGAGRVAQMVEHLPTSSTTKKEKRQTSEKYSF